MSCQHVKVEEIPGYVFCVECGEVITEFFGLTSNHEKPKPKTKLETTMGAYGFPTLVTKKALEIYKNYYGKNPVRKMIIFGCFCVAWPGNEHEIRTRMKLQNKYAQMGLRNYQRLTCIYFIPDKASP